MPFPFSEKKNFYGFDMIKQIKTELERQQKSLKNATGDFAEGRRSELRNLLEFVENMEKRQVMRGYLARDAFGDTLCIYSHKPYRPSEGLGVWHMRRGGVMQIDTNLFPDIGWENEPRECELSIDLL